MKILFLGTLLSLQVAQAAPDVEKILQDSDAARGGLGKGVSWSVQVKSFEGGESSDRSFVVRAKEKDALVESETPAKFKGEIYLLNDKNMWFYKPTLKKPVSISARQKLSGQAANGDIASTNYYQDYAPTMEKQEACGKDTCYVILLQAKTTASTYDKIRYWVSTTSHLGMKAEFLTIQGKPFKKALFEYKNAIKVNGKDEKFISRMLIQDVKNPEEKSILSYGKPKIEEHSISIFNVNNLSR
ncbi:MAG: outer membrane lipoprotein-sorting protein [Bdellovibrio sp.]